MRYVFFLLFINLSVEAQLYQQIEQDSVSQSRADIAGYYRLVRGMSGYVCNLDTTGELSYVLVDDIVPHREFRYAGHWKWKSDSVEFIIDDRRGLPPTIYSSIVPFSIRYKVLSFRWKMPTSLMNSAGNPVVFETVVKVLIESKDMYAAMIFAEFQQYFRMNYKPEADFEPDEWGFRSEAFKVTEMVNRFFNARKALCSVENYRNGVLQKF